MKLPMWTMMVVGGGGGGGVVVVVVVGRMLSKDCTSQPTGIVR
jgi:hypothetical protein